MQCAANFPCFPWKLHDGAALPTPPLRARSPGAWETQKANGSKGRRGMRRCAASYPHWIPSLGKLDADRQGNAIGPKRTPLSAHGGGRDHGVRTTVVCVIVARQTTTKSGAARCGTEMLCRDVDGAGGGCASALAIPTPDPGTRFVTEETIPAQHGLTARSQENWRLRRRRSLRGEGGDRSAGRVRRVSGDVREVPVVSRVDKIVEPDKKHCEGLARPFVLRF